MLAEGAQKMSKGPRKITITYTTGKDGAGHIAIDSPGFVSKDEVLEYLHYAIQAGIRSMEVDGDGNQDTATR